MLSKTESDCEQVNQGWRALHQAVIEGLLDGCFRLLFMHMGRGVVACGPFLNASTMAIVEGALPLPQLFLRQFPEDAPVHGVLELTVELIHSPLLDESLFHPFCVGLDLLVVQRGDEEGVGRGPLASLLTELEPFQNHVILLIFFVQDGACPELTFLAILARGASPGHIHAHRLGGQELRGS